MLPIHAPLARRASASHAHSALPDAPVRAERRGRSRATRRALAAAWSPWPTACRRNR